MLVISIRTEFWTIACDDPPPPLPHHAPPLLITFSNALYHSSCNAHLTFTHSPLCRICRHLPHGHLLLQRAGSRRRRPLAALLPLRANNRAGALLSGSHTPLLSVRHTYLLRRSTKVGTGSASTALSLQPSLLLTEPKSGLRLTEWDLCAARHSRPPHIHILLRIALPML